MYIDKIWKGLISPVVFDLMRFVVVGSAIHKKDLLATLHLLVAMVRHFQPELELPSDVKVQVALVEVSRRLGRGKALGRVLAHAGVPCR